MTEENRQVINRLFAIAAARLVQRGIAMKYTTSALDVLVNQAQDSRDPLRRLEFIWHDQVGNRIEQMLLDGRLAAGDALSVSVTEAIGHQELQYVISRSE